MLNEREQAARDPTIAETAHGLSIAFEKLKADISQSRAARFALVVLEKLKGVIQMEKTLKTGKIGQFGAESRITYGGVKWVVLDARPNMSLCIAEDVLKGENGEVRYMAFDTDNKNDFAAAFDIPATIGEGKQEEQEKEAKQLFGWYSELKKAGFTDAQAFELIKG